MKKEENKDKKLFKNCIKFCFVEKKDWSKKNTKKNSFEKFNKGMI